MTHDTDRLSEYLDDELTLPERAEVAAHLEACAECAAVLRDLRAVKARAAALPGSVPPAADPWPAVAARMATAPRAGRVLPWRVSLTLPQLAAAAALVLAIGMGGMWSWQTRHVPDSPAPLPATLPMDVTPIGLADASFDIAIADLEAVLEEGRAHLDPETIRVIEENLAAIDAAIAQAREALAADPGNIGLTHHLRHARALRLGLMRRVVAATRTAG
jgi:hypothetical protein